MYVYRKVCGQNLKEQRFADLWQKSVGLPTKKKITYLFKFYAPVILPLQFNSMQIRMCVCVRPGLLIKFINH